MMFGILFQEYYEGKGMKNINTLLNVNRLMWVVTSMILTMAFNGNLKTTLVVKTSYEQTKSMADIFEKDLTFHVSPSSCGYLETTAPLSPVNKALLRQAKNSDAQMILAG